MTKRTALPPEIETSPGRPLRQPLRPRTDLYFPPLAWAGGTELVYETREIAEQVGVLPAWEARYSVKDHLMRVLEDPEAIKILGVLTHYGEGSVESIYAIAGLDLRCDNVRSWARMPRPVRRLFGAGLIARGSSLSPAATIPVVLRVAKGAAMRTLLRRLDDQQLAWVTGGRKVESATRGSRHNCLAIDLAATLGAHSYVEAVVGPIEAKHHDLDPTGRTDHTRRAADLVATAQGSHVRLAIELTANGNPNALRHKVGAWLDFLQSIPDEDLGVRVVFLEAADPRRHGPNEIWSPLLNVIATELGSRPVELTRGLHERVAVARWRWWMTPTGPSDEIAVLAHYTWSPTGWQLGMLLGGIDSFNPREPDKFQDLLVAAQRSAGCPAVLRRR